MKARAHTNAYGTHTEKRSVSVTRQGAKYENGVKVDGWGPDTFNTNYMAYNCARTDGSKNPISSLGGASKGWRQPSAYGRWISNYRLTTGQRTNGPKNDGWVDTESVWLQDFITPGPPRWGSGIGFPEWDTNLLHQCQTEALVKLGDRKVDLGTALAESVQTFKLVAGSAEALFRSMIDFKRGHWDRIPSHLGLDGHGNSPSKKFADEFLKWKFGVVPIISDIYGGVELLKQKLVPAQIIHAKKIIRDDKDYKEYSNSGCVGSGSHKSNYTVKIWGRLSEASLRFANQANLTDPLTVAWEIVPWSFVIDWAIPVGNVLEGAKASAGLDFVAAYRSLYIEGRADWEIRSSPDWTVNKQCKIEHDYFSYKREVYPTWPSAVPYVTNPFKIGRAETALALLRQLL